MRVFYLVSTLLLIIFNSCKEKPIAKKEEKLISDSTMKLFRFDTARLMPIESELKLSGTIAFDDNKVVKVYPFSSGLVMNVNVNLGDYVTKGQTLAILRSADVAGNFADLSSAGNDIAIAKRNMENAEHLYNNGISSQREFIEAKENYHKALSNAQKIRAQIQINGGGRTSADGSYTVTAPRAGYIVERLINPGNFIRNDNSTSLFTIGDISDVWIWANVFETDISKVKEGYAAKITTVAYPERVFDGRVDKVSQFLDPVSKVMKVRIVLPNPGNVLKPEMFANIEIENKEARELVAVPTTSIISENGKNFVLVFNNQNDVRVQEVQLFKTDKVRTYLLNGVEDGERLITDNQILIFRKLTDK